MEARIVLHDFITEHREEIITRCIAKVATRTVPPLTAATINNGVPMFLDELVEPAAQWIQIRASGYVRPGPGLAFSRVGGRDE
jgi:hypothetical protein